MNLLQRIEHWGDNHHPRWIDILRVALGIFLVYRGIVFLENMGAELARIASYVSWNSFFFQSIGHLIVFAHLLGGVLLVLGTLTRFASLINIPILIGAIIFGGSASGLGSPIAEVLLAIVVLLLLCYFLVVGNGRWSFDRFMDATSK